MLGAFDLYADAAMIKAGNNALIFMFLLVVGSIALVAGAHPLGVALSLCGVGLLAVGTNTIIDRGRTRRGKPQGHTVTFADIAALNGRDWLQLATVTAVGICFTVTGVVAFEGGA